MLTYTDADLAIERLQKSERGPKALRAFKKFRESLWSLDSENIEAISALISAHYDRPGTLTELLSEVK